MIVRSASLGHRLHNDYIAFFFKMPRLVRRPRDRMDRKKSEMMKKNKNKKSRKEKEHRNKGYFTKFCDVL